MPAGAHGLRVTKPGGQWHVLSTAHGRCDGLDGDGVPSVDGLDIVGKPVTRLRPEGVERRPSDEA